MIVEAVAGAGAAALAYGFLVEAYRLGVSRIEFVCDRLPPQFDGFTILHLTDLHLRKKNLLHRITMPPLERRLERAINGGEFDMIALTGDAELRGDGFQAMRRLLDSVKTAHGVYFVPGNGEYQDYDIDSFLTEIQSWGVKTLRNDSCLIEREGAVISLIGVDDHFTKHSDLPRAMEGVSDDNFKLLLSHSPGIAREAVKSKIDLILSGHTHGGQLRLPILGTPYTHLGNGAPRLVMGVYQGDTLSERTGLDAGQTKVYVSRGVGMSVLYIRLFCPPEIAFITLRSGATGDSAKNR